MGPGGPASGPAGGKDTMLRMTAVAGLCLAAIAAPAAAGEVRCFEREGLVAYLEAEFGETRAALDFQEGVGLVEVFANRRTGTWTKLAVMPRGVSCILSTGDATPAAPGRREAPA